MLEKMKNNKPVTTSGTGYFISNSIIDKYNSFPFYTLTEDYEFSVNSTINNFSSFYNKKAIFYDEQPIDRKTTFIQRIRWCKGYQQVRKKYKQALKLKKHDKHALDEYYGVSYYISLIFCYALLILTSIVGIIYNTILKNNIIYDLTVLIVLIGALFIALELISFVLMRNLKEKKKFRDYIKALIYFPIYLSQFLPIYFKARFSNVEWEEIRHKGQ
jgi:cellulose synthase/poly-beta-1,6-N-acetylglucosamine synthase-like glycosyltransferase